MNWQAFFGGLGAATGVLTLAGAVITMLIKHSNRLVLLERDQTAARDDLRQAQTDILKVDAKCDAQSVSLSRVDVNIATILERINWLVEKSKDHEPRGNHQP